MKEFIKNNRTFSEMTLGELVFGVISELVLMIIGIWYEPLHNRALYYSLGLLAGIFIAVFYGYHMYRSIERALDFDEDTARKLATKDNLIRYGALVLVMAGLMLVDVVSPLTAFLGIMSIKAGAYMQPLMYKITVIFIGEEPVSESIAEPDDNDIQTNK